MKKLSNNKGITLIVLVVTIVILLIIAGVGVSTGLIGIDNTKASTEMTEINMISHAILERYTKAQLTVEELPGVTESESEIARVLGEIQSNTGIEINLKDNNKSNYKVLNKEALQELGITQSEDEYIVNYETGEVINKTKMYTKTGKALYVSIK